MPDLSYLIVNTNGREHLLRCLDSVLSTMPDGLATEVLVLDNASTDGSAEAVAKRFGDRVRLLHREERRGKADNDTALLEASSGELCLLLNEDSELRPGAVDALVRTLRAEPRAAACGAQLLAPSGGPVPCAWRFPSLWTALAGALFLHRLVSVQSGGEERREVDWCQSSALLVRRAAYEQVGGLDPAFFVYSDEVDWQRRMHDAGWTVLLEPAARAVHHEQLRHDGVFSRERIVELHRNRDRYLRKHHGAAHALMARALTAWAYAARAVASLALPGRSPRRFAAHARAALWPKCGEGLREAAERFNAGERRPTGRSEPDQTSSGG